MKIYIRFNALFKIVDHPITLLDSMGQQFGHNRHSQLLTRQNFKFKILSTVILANDMITHDYPAFLLVPILVE